MRPMTRCVIAVLVIVAAASTPRPASAQFRLGGGMNLSDFFGDNVGDNERKSGLDMGLSMPLFRTGPLALRAEGYYRQKGASNVMEFQDGVISGQDFDVGIDYVEVPVI